MEKLKRTEMLFGKEKVDSLSKKRVIVFGIGGVGGYTCEALARTGVGAIDLVDNDTVAESNINRQIIALSSTVGKYKTEAMRDRIKDINPEIKVNVINEFFTSETVESFDFTEYDYIVDAIDTVSTKIALVEKAYNLNIPIISAMGAGNKTDPCAFKVADIYKTSVCPLARAMRQRLKEKGIKRLKVVYSEEKPSCAYQEKDGGRLAPASCAFVPSVAGLIIASEVIKDLMNK